ncbi:Hypothetical predicted protein, partial [Olea europaea subsp. europaea]
RTGRVATVRFEKCFNGIGVGGGGGSSCGKVKSEIARVLGNHALAILLTYLFMIGQVGWLLDAIVALWLCPFCSQPFSGDEFVAGQVLQ